MTEFLKIKGTSLNKLINSDIENEQKKPQISDSLETVEESNETLKYDLGKTTRIKSGKFRFNLGTAQLDNFKHYFRVNYYIENVYKKVDHQKKFDYLFKNETSSKTINEIFYYLISGALSKNFLQEKGLMERPGIEVFEDFYKIFFYKNGCKFFESIIVCYLTKINIFNALKDFSYPNSASYAGQTVNLFLKNKKQFGQKSHIYHEIQSALVTHFEFINFTFIEAYRIRILHAQAIGSYEQEMEIFLKNIKKGMEQNIKLKIDTKTDSSCFATSLSEYDVVVVETFLLAVEFFEYSSEIFDQINPFCVKIIQAMIFEKANCDIIRNRLIEFMSKFFENASENVLIKTFQSCEMMSDLKEFFVSYKKTTLIEKSLKKQTREMRFIDRCFRNYLDCVLTIPSKRNLVRLREHFKASVNFTILQELFKKEVQNQMEFETYLQENFSQIQVSPIIGKENIIPKSFSSDYLNEYTKSSSKYKKRISEVYLAASKIAKKQNFRY